MWVKDLIDEDHIRHTMHHKAVEKKYNVQIPFTEYYGQLKAMPKEWHLLLNQPSNADREEMEDYKIIVVN